MIDTPPTDRPLTAGDIDWSAPLPDALWSHFNLAYGLSREEASEAAGEVLDIIAQQSARPATSAASEGERAIAKRLLSTNFDFLHPKMEPSEQMEFEDSITNAITNALASPPVSEREREAIDRLKKGVWTGEKDSTTVNMCDLNDALAVIRRLTAQPAGEGK